jgi:hypothetical protein
MIVEKVVVCFFLFSWFCRLTCSGYTRYLVVLFCLSICLVPRDVLRYMIHMLFSIYPYHSIGLILSSDTVVYELFPKGWVYSTTKNPCNGNVSEIHSESSRTCADGCLGATNEVDFTHPLA